MNQNTDGVSREMSKYKSHKIIHALKIAEIAYHDADADGKFGATIEPADGRYGPFTVPYHTMFAGENRPGPGWYYVVYSGDGYVSYSPEKAFEEGYSLIN